MKWSILALAVFGAQVCADDTALRIAIAQAQAEAEVAAADPPIVKAMAPKAESKPVYEWKIEARTPGQINLYERVIGHVLVQIGAMNAAGDYFGLTDGKWNKEPSEPPTLPSVSQLLKVVRKAVMKADRQTNNTISEWRSHPLNVGSCPCGKTGGCRCDPHSDCASGKCASHNPYLNAAPAVAAQPFHR